jgi:hypothetical protein
MRFAVHKSTDSASREWARSGKEPNTAVPKCEAEKNRRPLVLVGRSHVIGYGVTGHQRFFQLLISSIFIMYDTINLNFVVLTTH